MVKLTVCKVATLSVVESSWMICNSILIWTCNSTASSVSWTEGGLDGYILNCISLFGYDLLICRSKIKKLIIHVVSDSFTNLKKIVNNLIIWMSNSTMDKLRWKSLTMFENWFRFRTRELSIYMSCALLSELCISYLVVIPIKPILLLGWGQGWGEGGGQSGLNIILAIKFFCIKILKYLNNFFHFYLNEKHQGWGEGGSQVWIIF